MRRIQVQRKAASMVEFALVGPLTLMVLMSLIVGGMGMFRYQQVARLAREAARYASLHCYEYSYETDQSAALPADVYTQVIAPNAVGLDLSRLTYSVTGFDGQPLGITNNKTYRTTTVNGQTVYMSNTVSVTINYQWIPEAYLGGITMSSTAVCVISY